MPLVQPSILLYNYMTDLNEGLVSDHFVKFRYVGSKVHIEHQIFSHFLKSLQTGGVVRLMKLMNDVTQ